MMEKMSQILQVSVWTTILIEIVYANIQSSTANMNLLLSQILF